MTPDVFFKKTTLDELTRKSSTLSDLYEHPSFTSQIKPADFTGIKIHFGEQGNTSYINPRILRPLVQSLKKKKARPFFFDTNTLYRGKRMNSVDHLALAQQHGFMGVGIPVFIADGLTGNDYIEIPVAGRHYTKCYLASLWRDIDVIVSVSHFTMHMLTGFGAAIKNMGMGIASRRGKLAQHCEIAPTINEAKCISCGECARNCSAQCIEKKDAAYAVSNDKCIGCAQCIAVCPQGAVTINWSMEYTFLQERIVEYALAATSGKRCVYLTFCTYITKECDCMNKEEKGCIPDVGVFMSLDPVACDKACVDMILKRENRDVIKEIHPPTNYEHQFTYARQLALGSDTYTLITL